SVCPLYRRVSVATRKAEQTFQHSKTRHFPLRTDRRRTRRRRRGRGHARSQQGIAIMPRDFIILECTEAKAEGKPVSRYISTRNKKSPNTPNRLEKKKYNPNLKRHTLHRETKKYLMQPKTPQRRSNFRKANRTMPRRRIDIALEALDYKNP